MTEYRERDLEWLQAVVGYLTSQRRMDPEVAARHIYTQWFAQMEPAPSAEAHLTRFAAQDIPHYQPGWQIRTVNSASVLVQRDRVVPVQSGQCQAVSDPHDHFSPSLVAISLGGSFVSTEGFFHMFGTTPREWPNSTCAVKIYINARADVQTEIAEWSRYVLDREAIPFEYKADIDTHRCGRTDSAVLYLGAYVVAPAARLLVSEFSAHDSIRERTPPFTLRIAPGIALAPEPRVISYGAKLCEGIVSSVLNVVKAGAGIDAIKFAQLATYCNDSLADWPAEFNGHDLLSWITSE